jgi:hypothetical protein
MPISLRRGEATGIAISQLISARSQPMRLNRTILTQEEAITTITATIGMESIGVEDEGVVGAGIAGHTVRGRGRRMGAIGIAEGSKTTTLKRETISNLMATTKSKRKGRRRDEATALVVTIKVVIITTTVDPTTTTEITIITITENTTTIKTEIIITIETTITTGTIITGTITIITIEIIIETMIGIMAISNQLPIINSLVPSPRRPTLKKSSLNLLQLSLNHSKRVPPLKKKKFLFLRDAGAGRSPVSISWDAG